MKFSIIIPAYNEGKRIGQTLESYSSFFEQKRLGGELEYECIVVINNTTDNTEEIVSGFAQKNKRIRYLNFLEGGKGFAVIRGFQDALLRKNDLIGFVDADMATDPASFYSLVKNMGRYDHAIIGSRYVRGAVVEPKQTYRRILSSRIFNVLVRSFLFLPYRDTQCGAKVFRREALEAIIPKLSMSQWAFDVELLYLLKKQGFLIREIPTRWSDKEYSTINFLQAGPWMASGVVRLRLINSPFQGFVRIYDSIMKTVRGRR